MEPKTFLNDFLEILYYLKNINYFEKDSNNFDLNNEEFEKIKKISNELNTEILILFWQFTIKTLEELNIVVDQNISIEMFLVRLLHIRSIKTQSLTDSHNMELKIDNKNTTIERKKKSEPINQIKNIIQEKDLEKTDINNKLENIKIKSFDDLIKLCNTKKEIKLKYELENNVNLVKFENLRIEISFNEQLDKNFIKDLTSKLNHWTGERWIITLSKTKGKISYKERLIKNKQKEIEEINKSKLFLELKNNFNDIKVVDVKKIEEENND